MHLPPHPFSFWLILASPLVVYLTLWVLARNPKVSLKPLRGWLIALQIFLLFPYIFLGAQVSGNKNVRLAVGMAYYSCMLAALWIQKHYMFEKLRPANAKWYALWESAEFSVPASGLRILVRDIELVSPWYVEKLGLRKLAVPPPAEPAATIFSFKKDGNSVMLTTRGGFQTGKTPILFAKKIGKMRDLMLTRGVKVSGIKQDRQGIHYFEIRDPEGNEIEVVEER
jgi:predicted enzyme related to lactoylglutathione lyase